MHYKSQEKDDGIRKSPSEAGIGAENRVWVCVITISKKTRLNKNVTFVKIIGLSKARQFDVTILSINKTRNKDTFISALFCLWKECIFSFLLGRNGEKTWKRRKKQV